MLYLLASILLMSALAVSLRWAVGRGADPHGLNAAYRVTGGLITLAVALPALDWSRLAEFWRLAGTGAMIAAVFYWLTGLASIKAIELGSLGVSWAVIRCSMIIPGLASLFFWHEVPLSPLSLTLGARVLGMVAVAGALFLLSGGQGRGAAAATLLTVGRGGSGAPTRAQRRGWLLWLGTAFVGQGAWEVCLRATRSYPDNQARSFFLLITFSLAMVLAGVSSAAARVRLGRREVLYGLLAGACALAASSLRVWALRDVDGIIVFPATTIGVVMLVQLAGFGFWRERPGRRALAGLALALGGMVLLTVRL
jgi:uncharacterized membrane protein